jgi:hypothetical protein
VLYPATLAVADADGLKDLTTLALAVADGVLEASHSLSSRSVPAPA